MGKKTIFRFSVTLTLRMGQGQLDEGG